MKHATDLRLPWKHEHYCGPLKWYEGFDPSSDDDNDLPGTANDDLLLGYSSNDVLIAGGGNDSVHGGTGADTIIAGPGDDIFDGGIEADFFLLSSVFDPDDHVDYSGAPGGVSLTAGASSVGANQMDTRNNRDFGRVMIPFGV